MNLVLTGDVSSLGASAKLSIAATSPSGIGNLEKNLTINIQTNELNRYSECPRVKLSGFPTDIINGNYGLIHTTVTNETEGAGYQYINQKLRYRTNRRFTEGSLLSDGTVDFGSGYIYSELRWDDTKARWEVYVYSDDVETTYNSQFALGKLCAYSDSTTKQCPVDLNFIGIVDSYGQGVSTGNGSIALGDNYISDCSELGLC
jgi:hypothetical protein